MKLRTEIDIKPFTRAIEYSDRVFMIGSCFTNNIGNRVLRSKFHATVNPTGTLFNPLSICNTLDRLSQCQLVSEAELHEGDMGWYHYDFHSSLNAPTRSATLSKINESITRGGAELRDANIVIITLGSAWLYHRVDNGGSVVANCHKEPARNFSRRRASATEIAERLIEVIDGSLTNKEVILTISPIRHLADGLAENSLSKATLRVAIEQVLEARPEVTSYFPSFEIMMDDLRDYRFYGEDMNHPSVVAIDYIWDIFSKTAFSEHTQQMMQRVLRIVKAAEHRAINPTSEAHRRHCEAQLRAIAELPEIEFGKESAYFCEQLEINL